LIINRQRRIGLSGLVAALVFSAASDAAACQFCIALPQRTEADQVLASDCVILARPDPVDPFRFAATETLKGSYDDSKIGLLVDSATRSYLKLHPDRSALLVRDETTGAWKSLGTIGQEYETLVRRLIAVAQGWRGPEAYVNRWQYFLPYFEHQDQRIRELAYLELARAPYEVIRKLGRSISRETYEPLLVERRYYEWRGLAILLLAQSDSVSDRRQILESFRAAERYGWVMHLDAWATAAIEVAPEATIGSIEENYLRSTQRTEEELQAIVRALSMQGSQQDAVLRERIVLSYQVLLQNFPQFAPQVAKDLASWNRTELADELSEITSRRGELQIADMHLIRDYVAVATRRKVENAHE
jgi:hypothetical protein